MSNQSIYDFTVADSSGNPVSLEDYRGKVVLIVNTASCRSSMINTALETLLSWHCPAISLAVRSQAPMPRFRNFAR